MKEIEFEDLIKFVTPIVSIGVPISFLLSVIYNVSYFYVFKLNILDYLSFSDYLKSAIVPLIAVFLQFLLNFIIGAFDEKDKSKISKKYRKMRRFIILGLMTCYFVVCWAAYFYPHLDMLVLILLLFFTFVYIARQVGKKLELARSADMALCVFIVFILSCTLGGFFQAQHQLKATNNASIVYLDECKNLQADCVHKKEVNVVRVLENYVLFISDAKISLIPSEHLVSVTYLEFPNYKSLDKEEILKGLIWLFNKFEKTEPELT
jgi:hypothetical protein